jgi:hypothetical protein
MSYLVIAQTKCAQKFDGKILFEPISVINSQLDEVNFTIDDDYELFVDTESSQQVQKTRQRFTIHVASHYVQNGGFRLVQVLDHHFFYMFIGSKQFGDVGQIETKRFHILVHVFQALNGPTLGIQVSNTVVGFLDYPGLYFAHLYRVEIKILS